MFIVVFTIVIPRRWHTSGLSAKSRYILISWLGHIDRKSGTICIAWAGVYHLVQKVGTTELLGGWHGLGCIHRESQGIIEYARFHLRMFFVNNCFSREWHTRYQQVEQVGCFCRGVLLFTTSI